MGVQKVESTLIKSHRWIHVCVPTLSRRAEQIERVGKGHGHAALCHAYIIASAQYERSMYMGEEGVGGRCLCVRCMHMDDANAGDQYRKKNETLKACLGRHAVAMSPSPPAVAGTPRRGYVAARRGWDVTPWLDSSDVGRLRPLSRRRAWARHLALCAAC